MRAAPDRLRVALLADDFNPEWPSLPIVAFKYAKALASRADVTVFTHVRNKPNLEKLRQLDPLAKVVVVSADVQTSSQQLVDQAGAKAFITKPFDRDEIIGTLNAVLGGIR